MTACTRCGQENPDGFRFCGACGAGLGSDQQHPEVRKVVTAVFCDIVGSTPLGERLDPEIIRAVMGRYFVEMHAVVERFGGRVSKFIGDAVLALFGVPALHEDDALRAVGAAAAMREQMGPLNMALRRDFGVELAVRIGVATGDVVVGGDDDVVLGDVLNTAARLQQTAEPGSVLIDDSTHRLVRHAITAEAAPLRLKGKAEETHAWRLVTVDAAASGVTRAFDRALIGRDREISLLQGAFTRAVEERRCGLVTVLAAPGVGKSRLALELVASVQPAAQVLVGRCLSFGEGITYAPLAEMVRSVAHDMDALRRLLADAEDAGRVSQLAGASAGLVSQDFEGEETPWAYRRLFEELARVQPLLLVFEDIHWAEPTLLDLIDYVVEWASDAPVLLLCLARPELFERRPTWGGGRGNALAITLDRLPPADADRMLDDCLRGRALPVPVRAGIEAAAQGVPLFIEQMIAMLDELDTIDDMTIPPAVQALLAARLDNLPGDERALLERAAVEGEAFTLAAVVALGSESPEAVATMAAGLRRRGLVYPQGTDRFRFAHALLRDAAYDRIPKRRRADLHERHAAWLSAETNGELVGNHLERAVMLRRELGERGDHTRALAGEAADRLAAAARQATRRGDDRAAGNLLERAVILTAEDPETQLPLLADLGAVLSELDPRRALRVLEDGIAAASALGADAARWRCVVLRSHLLMLTRPNDRPFDDLLEEAERGAAALEGAGDSVGHAEALSLISDLRWCLGRGTDLYRSFTDSDGIATNRAIAHAADALRCIGPPLATVEAELRTLLAGTMDNPVAQAILHAQLGIVLFMRGDEGGRAMMDEARSQLEAMGQYRWASEARFAGTEVDGHAGDFVKAEREYALVRAQLEAAGQTLMAAGATVHQAVVLCELGRTGEAVRLVDPPPSLYDLEIRMRTYEVQALAKLAQGDAAGALAEINRAVDILQGGDWADMGVTTYLRRATVLDALGRHADARRDIEVAAEIAAQRGNEALAARVRRRM
jgi:class 3 adenylate cyclase